MNTWPIVILALALAVVILLYCNRKIRSRLESIRGLLDIINTVAALSVFASLYYTIQQFKVSQRQQEKQELQQLAQVLGALVQDFDANIDVCNKILADQTSYTNAISVPENRFHTDILQHFLVTGALNDARLRQLMPEKVATDYISERRVGVTFFNTYHRMLIANDLIARSVDIMTLQVLTKTDAEILAKTDYRVRANMRFLTEDANELRETLTAFTPIVTDLRDRCVRLAEEKR